MKKIIALLALVIVAGCSHPDYHANIQAVLNQKAALRTRLIGTEPFSRVVFPAGKFATGLAAMPLSGCPDDFKAAWSDYAAAWSERASRHPDGLRLAQAGIDGVKKLDLIAVREDLQKYKASVPTDRTPAAWRNVELISARYGAFPN